ncbi:hypothetical protein BDM02DRAFT_3126726 [Thelephora ganbajun]|uniref:Uncharacterized protein n=1 Tax=Thelephora ganbajun TaxID=370292 RepID=A0ACB6ZPV8_THEGA|nr:hypothetical protein BDM02DRAFT_3126726 [Thelephora ganbajun]
MIWEIQDAIEPNQDAPWAPAPAGISLRASGEDLTSQIQRFVDLQQGLLAADTWITGVPLRSTHSQQPFHTPFYNNLFWFSVTGDGLTSVKFICSMDKVVIPLESRPFRMLNMNGFWWALLLSSLSSGPSIYKKSHFNLNAEPLQPRPPYNPDFGSFCEKVADWSFQ